MIRPKKTSGSHVSAASGTDPRMSTIRSTPALIGREREKLKHSLQPATFAEAATDLGRGEPVGEHDVAGEVVLAADERRADAVGVDGDAPLLEGADLLRVETARGDDLDALEAVLVKSVAHLPHEALVDARRLEVAHLLPERPIDKHLGGVEAQAPQTIAQCACDLERGPDRIVLEVDENGDVQVRRRPLGELRGR